MKVISSLSAAVTRGPESWNYIYVALGFALTIESTIIPMIEPLKFPCNIIAYAVIGAVTVWLFLFNGRFQNWLIGIKNKYEGAARSPH
jgi:hypothetical protein